MVVGRRGLVALRSRLTVMDSTPEDQVDEFRLDRTHFSVARLTDADDAVEYWLSPSGRRRLRASFCEGPPMAIPALPRDFKEFLKLLNSNEVEYLLIGGCAVAIHGLIRAKR